MGVQRDSVNGIASFDFNLLGLVRRRQCLRHPPQSTRVKYRWLLATDQQGDFGLPSTETLEFSNHQLCSACLLPLQSAS